jgi:hypothetical protein
MECSARNLKSLMGADDARYAFHDHGHWMTPKEKLAGNHLGGMLKANLERSDRAALGGSKPAQHICKYLSDDSNVLLSVRGGDDAFVVQAGPRILSHNQGEIVLHFPGRNARIGDSPTVAGLVSRARAGRTTSFTPPATNHF